MWCSFCMHALTVPFEVLFSLSADIVHAMSTTHRSNLASTLLLVACLVS